MPATVPALTSLPEYIRGLARLGSRAAVIEHQLYRSTTYSYANILGKSFALRLELERRGVRAGDRVIVWGASGAAWAIAFYGCVLAGAVVVPLDAAFSAAFADRVRRQTEAVLLCTDHPPLAGLPALAFAEITALPPAPRPEALPVPAADTLLEIVYTSGATAEPKGVMITHGNLLANLQPIAREIAKYKPKAGLFLPLRFLHLIPLSHLFGQVMGLCIPPLLDSAVVYPESQVPAHWAAAIRRYRVSAMVAVPQQLELFSQWAAADQSVSVAELAARGRSRGIAWSWWHWRQLHRKLGWKMWAYIVGGAALPQGLEDFWNALGYAVIQGYGLTETAPAIAITHPFKIRRGAVGRMLAGVETKLAPDGEILVRGGNVSPGYYRNREATEAAFGDGWLHTGDLGRLDSEGNLHFLGRKKEVIVTPEGLNVYPQDVENALERQPAIAEAAVVEARYSGRPQVHAVAVLRPGAGAEALQQAVTAANLELEPHQRVRTASLWPEAALPRTASTRKLQRVAIARWVNGQRDGAPTSPSAAANDWKEFVQQRWGVELQRLQPQARLDADLGLSSLDRVELGSWLEAHAAAIAEPSLVSIQTVADLDALLASTQTDGLPGARPIAEARPPAILVSEADWPMHPSLRAFRAAAFPSVVFPFLWTAVSRVDVSGRERFASLHRPVLFVSNHQSALDVPVILRALPRNWRPWLAPAMGIDPVADALNPTAPRRRRWRAWRRFQMMRAFFNTYLLTDRGAIGLALRHTGKLADLGFCPLIFPEGRRTPDGKLHPFRPGIGVFVAALKIPVMTIRIDGLYEILPDRARHPKRGRVRVTFGPVFEFRNESAENITRQLQSWYRMPE